MRTSFAAFTFCAALAWFSNAQESSPPAGSMACITNDDEAAHYAELNQRVLEFSTQSDLLKELVEEHKKRAQETLPGQEARNQWENELAKNLAERAAAIVPLLANASRERLA